MGVLALQGAFLEHCKMLEGLGAVVRLIRLPRDLADIQGIVLPGGESTTMGELLTRVALLDPLRQAISSGLPTLATCAGMIMLADRLVDGEPGQPILGLVPLRIRRNGFGRQVDSFEVDLDIERLGNPPFHAVFIRAPVIEEVGHGVEVLARLAGKPVAIGWGKITALSFHPELSGDDRWHRRFLEST